MTRSGRSACRGQRARGCVWAGVERFRPPGIRL